MDLSSNILKTLVELCSLKSTSGTTEESYASQGIASIISRIGYFKDHPDGLKLHPIKGDPYGRSYITALLEKGASKKTVVLISHFDVVGIEEFGHLKKFAYSPLEFTERLKDERLSYDIKADLDSEDWLFGRGTMDMKCGLAVHIELLRYIYENNIDFDGKILLLTVPDEENSSAGMLSAVEHLSSLKNEGYDFQGVINSEPHFPEYPGDDNNYIYTGTIGKLLPFIFSAGIETHAGEPFNGISSSLLSSCATYLMEANAELCEGYGSFITPPPVCLKQEDFKDLYSVSTPSYSYAYYNYMTLTSSAKDVIEKVRDICAKAFDMAMKRMVDECKSYDKLAGARSSMRDMKPKVITYDELCSMLKNKGISIEDVKKKFEGSDADTRDLTALIVSDMLKCLPELRPVMVVGFAPPYYPHRTADKDSRLMEICHKVIERSKDSFNESLIQRDIFPGLCDLSYIGLENPDDYYALESNMPVLNTGYSLPIHALSNINIDGINIGVRGKDAHKYTERLHMPYSFKVTPNLVYYAIMEFLL